MPRSIQRFKAAQPPDTTTYLPNTSGTGQNAGAMTATTDVSPRRVPAGVYPADHSKDMLIPGVPVRCRKQAPDEAPRFVRPRFGGDMREISGALADLPTFIPHALGAVSLVGMAPAGVFVGFGLFYILSGAAFGLPIAVQPMKAASAVMLITPMPPEVVAGAGLVIGVVLLVAALTGLIGWLARSTPHTVAAGIQLGLGVALAFLGIRLMASEPVFGLAMLGLVVALLRVRWLPAALVVVIVGAAVGQALGTAPAPPALKLGIHLPPLMLPSWEALARGAVEIVLPQLGLTLVNAILAAAAVARQLFPREVHAANERNLALSQGLANTVGAFFGAYPMCHGAGGMVAHHRFGARTATAPLLIGTVLLAFGVLLGDQAIALLRLVPEAALGALLVVSGLDLAKSAQPQTYRGKELGLVVAVAACAAFVNPALAFVLGWAAAHVVGKSGAAGR